MIAFPNCKINLGLHVTGKRSDGFHDLQTIFYPVPLTDALEIIKSNDGEVSLSTSGIPVDVSDEQNICVIAYRLLQSNFPELTGLKMHLHKVIPTGAGLGGGSADGAFALQLLNKVFQLQLTTEQLSVYALQLGSDCPFFMLNKPALASGRGEQLQPVPVDISAYYLMIVHPGIHVSTAWAFSQLRPQLPSQGLTDIIKEPVENWRDLLTNHFEEVVFAKHPQIRFVKEKMYASGAIYASMSGSGSAVFGLFNTSPSISFPAQYFVKTISPVAT